MTDGTNQSGSDTERPIKGEPVINAPRVVLGLIAVFVATHILGAVSSKDSQDWLLLTFAFNPARYSSPIGLSGYVFPGGKAADLWTFVTHMFLHGDWTHLIINCVWMLAFGSVVARRLGAVRFILFSALTAAMGAALNLAIYWGNFSILLGASGAISGQMAGAVRMMFAGHEHLASLNRPEVSHVRVLSFAETLADRRALTFIFLWLAINALFGVMGIGLSGDINRIAWEAHAGGFVGGLLLFGWFDGRSMR